MLEYKVTKWHKLPCFSYLAINHDRLNWTYFMCHLIYLKQTTDRKKLTVHVLHERGFLE